MRFIKVALAVVGLTFGAQTFAAEEVTGDDSVVYLFGEGDVPADAEEAQIFPEDSPDSARVRIHCASHNYRLNRCRVDGRIRSVRLVRRTSFAPCIAGRTFGATPRYVWVTRGCSGNFVVRYRRFGGWNDDVRH